MPQWVHWGRSCPDEVISSSMFGHQICGGRRGDGRDSVSDWEVDACGCSIDDFYIPIPSRGAALPLLSTFVHPHLMPGVLSLVSTQSATDRPYRCR